ncbi:hypothetical protein RRF57_007456 [Xylaria bambusicola]|uniref:protein-ribulosamine 3-kinase n=1 Tax=Xylaria bambusicola TaxID=326684 RepID=A0AAN7Z6B3_9PEZI
MATLIVDENVIKALPSVKEVVSVSKSGESAWARASRIDVLHEDNSEESYFMKVRRRQVSRGHHGLEALKGEFESTSAIYAITPDFCPRPIAWGTFKADNDSHFYICKFYEFTDGLPNPKLFCANLAKLHSFHTSPTGKFGFHVITYNGDLPQDNTVCYPWSHCLPILDARGDHNCLLKPRACLRSTHNSRNLLLFYIKEQLLTPANCSAFFESGLKHVLNIREARAGPSAELDELLQPFFGNVIPRLLRPLETVHGDLWCGNAAITDEDTGEGIVFDPSSFWGHNECTSLTSLPSVYRPERSKFTRRYFNAYHLHIPKSALEDDYDDRNALYAMVIDEMRRLVQKFPDGYTGHSPRADTLARRNANAMAVGKNAEVQQYAGDVDEITALPSRQGQSVSAEIEL